MKDTVRHEDIKRFDEPYHLFVRQNIASKSCVPDELKDLFFIDISVINIVSSNPDRIINNRDRRFFGIKLTDKGISVQPDTLGI